MKSRRVKRHTVIQPLDQSVRHIPLTQGLTAIVDADDYATLSEFNWTAHRNHNTYYAERNVETGKGRATIKMHRVILCMSPSDDIKVDHINRNGLDNRKLNLRKATISDSNRNRRLPSHNTSGVRGVSWNKAASRWRVQISLNGRNKHVGYFFDLSEAASAYNSAVKRNCPKFGIINAVKPTIEKEKVICRL